jgi:hypothetical protein
MTTTIRPLLTVQDVGAWLTMPIRQVERMARQGLIPCRKLPDGTFVFKEQELATWVEALPKPGRGPTNAA